MPDRAQSILLTRLIALAYDDRFLVAPEAVAKVALAALGFDLVSVVWGTDFLGLFGQERVPYGTVSRGPNGHTYVALRGTATVKEWLEDCWAVPEPWPFSQDPGVHTHQGFTDLFETLSDSQGKGLLGALAGEQVIVTGHSLGAALAALCAAALGASCAYCETCEGPRVGNEAFCKWMDGRVPAYFRDVIIGDVVPHAPPENLGYFHPGVEIDLDPSGVIPLTLDPEEYLKTHHVLTSVQLLLEAPA